jgi:hypothetical protein
MSRTLTACGAVFALASAVSTEAQTASGAFTAQPGGSINPKVAAAYSVRDQFNPRQRHIEVILSTTPVDVAKAVAELGPHEVVINDPAVSGSNYVLLWVESDGKVSMNATFGKTMTQYVDRTDNSTLKAELTTNTKDRVAGRLFTPAPVKTQDGTTYTVDLTFSAPVAAPPAATALPAGGGDPGKALASLFAARQKKDWAALKAAFSPAATERFVKSYNNDQENLKDALDTMDFWLPNKNATIIGGQVRGDTAIVEVEGPLASGVKVLTVVRMIKAPAGWLFDRAQMAGMLP